VDEAIRQLNLPLEIEIIGDLRLIRAAGLKMTPALILEGKILHQGRTLNLADTKALLEKALLELKPAP
jgi:hypothetical protein